jgi:phytanoyl-CoA hydroxylase
MSRISDALLGGHARRLARWLRGPRFTSPPRTPAERRVQYERDGFVAGGELADRKQLARLRADFDEIFAARQRSDSGIEHERLEDGAGGEYFKVYNLHRLSPAFHQLVTHPRLIAGIADITGCHRLRVLLDQILYKPPGSGGWNGMHRDMPSFPLIRPYTALTAWVALDDATEENGCLRMVPGSHAWGDATDVAGDDWGLHTIPRIYHGHEVREVPRPLRAGHVHFHHELTWHCSAPNPTVTKRRAFVILFLNADARYRSGGRIVFPELAHGDALDAIAPLVVTARV